MLKRPKKPVFIMGNPRSGTSLVYRIIQRHSLFAPKNIKNKTRVDLTESQFFPHTSRFHAFNGEKYLLGNRRAYQDFLNQTRIFRAMYKFSLHLTRKIRETLSPSHRATLFWFSGGRAIARTYFAIAKAARGSTRLVEKTPNTIRFLPEVFSAFPDAQCIFLLRHPVDVFSSYRRRAQIEDKPWMKIDARKFVDLFENAVLLAKKQQRQTPAGMKIVKFEDITNAPKKSVSDLCTYLGIPFEENMLSYNPKESTRSADPLLTKAIVPSQNTKQWRDFLSAEDAEYVQSELSALMKEFGYKTYETNVPEPDPAAPPELSIILPCRNEEAALRTCLQSIKQVIQENNIRAEIIVSDSSTDNSPQIALEEGVRLIKHDREGYGAAYLAAFPHVRGTYIFCADADGSYDFKEIPRFLRQLHRGKEFVIGNRFSGNVRQGAMPFLNQFIGNPFLTRFTKILFRVPVNDVHCGMRALTKTLWQRLHLATAGMEFASEMVIKAARHTKGIVEMPIEYHPRIGTSKLRPFVDGWRHVRLLILYSPLQLLLVPGGALALFGTAFILADYKNIMHLIVGVMTAIAGYQLLIFALFSKIYAIVHIGEYNHSIAKIFKHLTLPRVGLAAAIVVIVSIAGVVLASDRLYALTAAMAILIVAIQTVTAAFMFSTISIHQ
ncbi:MAG: sulfotransferase [Candidatus Andersenbacteria bacterium]|nr:sulfotransferase [Candidatus Andersenbacteria bacterium]MBI3250894.1 sulfotransferase [Candidatus Andersenbacteria bacterium]